MSPEQINGLAKSLAGPIAWQLWPFYVAAGVFLILSIILISYLKEKGKNAATKEDIQQITRQIAEIHSEYNRNLENIKGTYQIQAVALEKRLEVLQEAFLHWRELIYSAHDDKNREPVIKKCADWWAAHCIYLPESVRDPFMDAVMAARIHHQLLNIGKPRAEIEDNWAKIKNLSNLIQQAARLPNLPSSMDTSLKLPTSTHAA